ncbi:hypothetical protein HBB16_09410 [Pseudonocardia sp. MCCB 268]|nr:hypothetical protein [Pseudonocardia cytotoxica]
MRTRLAEFQGRRPGRDRGVDLRMSGVRSDYTATRQRKVGGAAELASIEQLWLRRVLVDWAELEHPTSSVFSQTLKAVRFTPQAWRSAPAAGTTRPRCVHRHGRGYRPHLGPDQARRHPLSPSTPRNWVWTLFRLLDYASRAGSCDELAAAFVQGPQRACPAAATPMRTSSARPSPNRSSPSSTPTSTGSAAPRPAARCRAPRCSLVRTCRALPHRLPAAARHRAAPARDRRDALRLPSNSAATTSR